LKRKLRKILSVTLISLSIIGGTSQLVMAAPSSPSRHVAYRFVWGCKAETEWECYHYTRVWISPWGTDSGRKWGDNLTKATAYGDALTSTAQSRYGR